MNITFRRNEFPKTPEGIAAWVKVAHTIERNIHPVVGLLTRDEGGEKLGTGYLRFENMALKIAGLCIVDGRQISILAVISEERGQGNFSKFLDQLKAAYDAVEFVAVMNSDLAQKLSRSGFAKTSRKDSDGTNLKCLLWTR